MSEREASSNPMGTIQSRSNQIGFQDYYGNTVGTSLINSSVGLQNENFNPLNYQVRSIDLDHETE